MRAKGTGQITKEGYVYHERNGVAKFAHVLIAERALGKELPKGCGVHHVNGDKADNRPGNLVIFPSQEYHFLLHRRTAALEATGDANKRKCSLCGAYDDVGNLYVWGRVAHHKTCKAKYDKARKTK